MEICVFSKRLKELGFSELGRALRGIGVDGVDLTVRPGGHVEPGAAAEKLPEAVESLSAEGVKVAMITTGITAADGPHAREVLESAAQRGIRYVKLGYYGYQGFGTLRKSMAEARARLRDLAALAGELGLFLGCHNHSGAFIGAHLAHLRELIDDLDPEAIGIYFDPAHAVVEGARGGWQQALDDAAARVRMLAVKDFALLPGGKLDCVPLGQGLAPWPEVVAVLKRIGNQLGPLSIHAEPDLPLDEALSWAAADKARFEEFWAA